MAVVPGPGAQQDLLAPGADVLQHAPHQKAAGKGELIAPVAVLVQAYGQQGRPRAVEEVKGAVDQTGPALDVAVGHQAPEHLHHHAGKAAGNADEQHLVQAQALGEVVLLGLLQINGRVGGGIGDVPLPVPGRAHVPQAGPQLVGRVVRRLIGLGQGPGGPAQALQLRLHRLLQRRLLRFRGAAVLRGQGLLRQRDVVPLRQGRAHRLHRLGQALDGLLQGRGEGAFDFFHSLYPVLFCFC